MSEEKKIISDFVAKWRAEHGIDISDFGLTGLLLQCQNDWMASEEFGKLYGWRLEPQNEGQRRMYDELVQRRAQLEEELKKEAYEKRLKIMKGDPEE